LRKESIRARVKGDLPIAFSDERISARGGLELLRRFLVAIELPALHLWQGLAEVVPHQALPRLLLLRVYRTRSHGVSLTPGTVLRFQGRYTVSCRLLRRDPEAARQ